MGKLGQQLKERFILFVEHVKAFNSSNKSKDNDGAENQQQLKMSVQERGIRTKMAIRGAKKPNPPRGPPSQTN